MSAVPKTRLAKQFALINQISFPSNRSAAVKFSPQLAKVELIFKKKNYGGHMGLRKFWQTYLPTLKFYNEELQFSVKRISLSEGVKDKEKALQLETDRELVEKCPSKIVLQYADAKKVELDCKNKHSDEILSELIKISKAEKVPEAELVKFNNNEY